MSLTVSVAQPDCGASPGNGASDTTVTATACLLAVIDTAARHRSKSKHTNTNLSLTPTPLRPEDNALHHPYLVQTRAVGRK